uniref:Uncharacterized protein n=1 Tax=Oryza sativa subsp. japonica TaxID=39947 RepID=Q69SF4_ORYSJ|nr:hypothetical protein [Oryza sativa Japonica Group]BAD30814.1 hypothetical protein [Oryza sativa Japonica Group]
MARPRRGGGGGASPGFTADGDDARREVHARLPWQGIGLGLTGEGEIKDGAQRPELEKDDADL